MAWTDLTFAFGSLLTSTKMTQLYDNLTALANGDSGAPRIQTPAYDDSSITETKLAGEAVSQGKLKTSIGSVSTSASGTWENLTLPGGEYGFYPQVAGGSDRQLTAYISKDAVLSGYRTNIALYVDVYVGYARQRYVTSSGEVFWIFLLRDKASKKIISGWQAPDHPCFGNTGKPLVVPHPFPMYDREKHEIIVINPTKEELTEMQKRRYVDADDIPDRDLLEVILEDYEIDEESNPPWPDEKVTVGLPPDWDDAYREGRSVEVIKKRIPQHPDLIPKKLRRRM